MAVRAKRARPGGLTGDAILVNAWVVSDGSQDEFVTRIRALLEYLRVQEGFLDGAVLRGVNPMHFLSYVRLRSPADRQRLLADPEVTARLRAASRVARADVHSYDVLSAYAPLGESQ